MFDPKYPGNALFAGGALFGVVALTVVHVGWPAILWWFLLFVAAWSANVFALYRRNTKEPPEDGNGQP